jgi:hypothetical protein
MSTKLSDEEAVRLFKYLQHSGKLKKGSEAWKNPPSWPFHEGQVVHIRAVPLYYAGRVKYWTDKVVVLTECAWVKNTGHFERLWKNPEGLQLRYYQPEEEVPVALEGISDWCAWPTTLEWPYKPENNS